MSEKKLTPYQSKIIGVLQRAPNTHADWYEVAWNDNDLVAEWGIPRKRGILITNIQKAAKRLESLQLIFIPPPPPHRKRCCDILPTAGKLGEVSIRQGERMKKDTFCQWEDSKCQRIAIKSVRLDNKIIKVCNRHFLIATSRIAKEKD